MADNTLTSPKINLWSDWWCLVGVSSQTIVRFCCNILLVNGKSFFSSQENLTLIHLWTVVVLEVLIIILY